jgi:hypothetical protein
LRQVRPREALDQQQLDLGPGLVRGGRHQLVGVPGSQVAGQHQHGSQVQAAFGQGHEDGWEPPGDARRVDVPVGRVLGEMQLVEAVGEHRVVAGLPVELALVDLGDAGEQHRGGPAVVSDERLQVMQQGAVAEVRNGEAIHGRGHQRGLVVISGAAGRHQASMGF